MKTGQTPESPVNSPQVKCPPLNIPIYNQPIIIRPVSSVVQDTIFKIVSFVRSFFAGRGPAYSGPQR